jgi:hypothetical protein
MFPNNGVYAINEIGDAEPSDKRDGGIVASSPVQWQRHENENSGEERTESKSSAHLRMRGVKFTQRAIYLLHRRPTAELAIIIR